MKMIPREVESFAQIHTLVKAAPGYTGNTRERKHESMKKMLAQKLRTLALLLTNSV